MFDFKSLKDIIDFIQNDPEIQDQLAESAQWRNRPIRSVWEMTEMFPPGFYETSVSRIHLLLVSLGFEDSPSLFELAEHLFSDIYIGRPQVDPAIF